MTLYTIRDDIMIKHSLLLLLMTLLFTACVERNQTLKPNIHTSLADPITKNQVTEKSQTNTNPTLKNRNSKQDVVEIKDPLTPKTVKVSQEKKVIPVPSVEADQTSIENKDFFTFSDDTKNKISGFFVIIIGILILI